MNTRPECLLVIVAPLALEDALTDELLAHPEWAPGFNSMRIEGHGHGLAWTSTREQVRGRVQRLRLEIVTADTAARALIEHLRSVLANPHVFYWIVTLDSCGRLSP